MPDIKAQVRNLIVIGNRRGGEWFLVYRCFFFSSRRRHTRFDCDGSSAVCSSDRAANADAHADANADVPADAAASATADATATVDATAQGALGATGNVAGTVTGQADRSEERRVGKGGKSRGSRYH